MLKIRLWLREHAKRQSCRCSKYCDEVKHPTSAFRMVVLGCLIPVMIIDLKMCLLMTRFLGWIEKRFHL